MEPSRFFCKLVFHYMNLCGDINLSLSLSLSHTHTHTHTHSEYYALVGGKRKKWTLQGDTLKSEEGSLTAKVLSEELAYNKSYKQYRMFITDRPLIEVTQRRKNTVTTSEDLLMPRKSVSEHLNLLECFAKHKEVSEGWMKWMDEQKDR